MNISLGISPQEFFRDQIRSAVKDQNIQFSEDIEFYLVNLLTQFIATSPDFLETPLALKYKNALEAPSKLKPYLYKSMGDDSLYIAGFFGNSFNRKVYDIEYFISMGGTAYRQLSRIIHKKSTKEYGCPEVFETLSRNFSSIVETLTILSNKLDSRFVPNVLSLYERWEKSGHNYLYEKLVEEGIEPVPVNLKIQQ